MNMDLGLKGKNVIVTGGASNMSDGTLCEKIPIATKYALRAINEGLDVELVTALKVKRLCLDDVSHPRMVKRD
jgi:hypothetical protein